MDITAEDTVDNLVAGNVGAAKVLSKHGIDFCTEGNRLLKEACTEARISLSRLLREIANTDRDRKKKETDLSQINIDELTRFIEKYHHHYTAENIIFIKTSLSRLVRLHGSQYAELAQIRKVFEEMTGRLTLHMKLEEFIVFPYIRRLARKGKKVRSSIFNSIKTPIAEVMTDHEDGQTYLHELHLLTHFYSPPVKGSAFEVTYAAMRELEQDLRQHMSLEENILFPKAITMETELHQLHRRGRKKNENESAAFSPPTE